MSAEQLDFFIKAAESQLKEYCQRLKTRQGGMAFLQPRDGRANVCVVMAEEREAQGYENEDEDAFTLEEEEDEAMLAEVAGDRTTWYCPC